MGSEPLPPEERTIHHSLNGILDRIDAQNREHERRMREDPEYRVGVERAQEEKRAIDAEIAAQEKLRMLACREERRTERGVPRRFWCLLEGGLQETPALAAVHAFLASPATLLVLAGPVGVGKSLAGAWAVDQPVTIRRPTAVGYIEIQGTARVVKAADLVRASTFDGPYWRKLKDVTRLTIDDLGGEFRDSKGLLTANLFDVLDSRYDNLLKTILTTNLTKEQFIATYCTDGGRLRDRLRESGRFVVCPGDSLREPLAEVSP